MLAQRGRAEDRAALGGEGFRQRHGRDDALAARAIEQTERPHKAFAPLADDSEAVCLVDDQERIVLDREVEQFAQRGSIPEHREDRLDDDDGARLGAFDELAAEAVEALVRRMDDPETPYALRRVTPTLRVAESTSAAPEA